MRISKKGPAVVRRGAADELFPFAFRSLTDIAFRRPSAPRRFDPVGSAPALRALSYCDASSIPPMRIRFARRPPLFRGEKSTKLSPLSADKRTGLFGVQPMTRLPECGRVLRGARPLTCAQGKGDWDPKSGLMCFWAWRLFAIEMMPKRYLKIQKTQVNQ